MIADMAEGRRWTTWCSREEAGADWGSRKVLLQLEHFPYFPSSSLPISNSAEQDGHFAIIGLVAGWSR